MTDFNRIRPNIPRTALSVAAPDVMERLVKRPLTAPALILFASCCLTFVSESIMPMLLFSLLLAVSFAYACRRHELSLVFCSVISLILVLASCSRMITVLRTSCPESVDGYYTGTVISCERKLSGDNRITVDIGGMRAELRFDKKLEPPDMVPGQSFYSSGRFKEPEKAGNPGEFDYWGYLKNKGIRYLFYADSFSEISHF